MKITETASYPHPVLAPWSADITGATISTQITFREEGDANQVSIHCAASLNQPDIVSLIRDGSATFGCFIKCQETGLRSLYRFGFPSGVHHFAPGALLGRVQVRPMVWAETPIAGYSPEGAHAEFAGEFDIVPGQLLALDDEQFILVTRLPLASIESIFEIMSSDQIPDGKFEVDTESDRVTVRMSEATYRLVQALRQTDDITRDVLMNSLYVPVVMQVLDQLTDGYEQFEKYRWLHPFRAKCEQADVDIEKLDLLNDAQRLLAQPFALLGNLIPKEED
jgi:hypothetical protein